MVFWYDGRASEARAKIDFNAPHSWHYGVGGTQHVYIDERSHGGSAHWQSQNFSLEEGSFTDRYHLRIFNGDQHTQT